MCVCVFVNFSILSIRMVWCAIFAGIFLYVATNISKSIWTKQQINSDDLWRPNSFPIILSRKEKKNQRTSIENVRQMSIMIHDQ